MKVMRKISCRSAKTRTKREKQPGTQWLYGSTVLHNSKKSLAGTSRRPLPTSAWRICRTRSRIHVSSTKSSGVGRVSNEGSLTRYSPLAKEVGMLNGSANKYDFLACSCPYSHNHPMQVGRGHHEYRVCGGTQVRRKLRWGIWALASIPIPATAPPRDRWYVPQVPVPPTAPARSTGAGRDSRRARSASSWRGRRRADQSSSQRTSSVSRCSARGLIGGWRKV